MFKRVLLSTSQRLAVVPSKPLKLLMPRYISFTKVDARPAAVDNVSEEDKKVCDPYNNGGKPFDEALVRRYMKLLSPKWVYDSDKKSLTRIFDFKPSYTKMEGVRESPRIPGVHVYTETTGAGGCFGFSSYINNICTNTDHWVYSTTVTPRKSEVEVVLKTVSRGGITQADINIAIQLDSLMKTTFCFTREPTY